MAFNLHAALFLVFILQLQNSNAQWNEGPWSSAKRSISFERQHMNSAVNVIMGQTSRDISDRVTPMVWQLNQIKNQAEYGRTPCTMKTIEDIDTFFGVMQIINECRNYNQVNEFKSTQNQQFDVEYAKIKQGQIECNQFYQQCATKVTESIQKRLFEIRQDTDTTVARIGEENAQCVEKRGNEMNDKLNEIQTNWLACA